MTYCDKSVLAHECGNKDCKKCYAMPPSLNKDCKCEEMSCKKDCIRKHTCHTYWCEKCQPDKGEEWYITEVRKFANSKTLESLLHKVRNATEKEIVEKIEKGFDSFLLQDWSGEYEVYDEINRLKKQILASLSPQLEETK